MLLISARYNKVPYPLFNRSNYGNLIQLLYICSCSQYFSNIWGINRPIDSMKQECYQSNHDERHLQQHYKGSRYKPASASRSPGGHLTMSFKKPETRRSGDRLSKIIESGPIRRMASTIMHPRKALSDAKEAQLEKRRTSIRESFSTQTQPHRDLSVRSHSLPQPPRVSEEPSAEFPSTITQPRFPALRILDGPQRPFELSPRSQDTVPKLREPTNLGHLAPPGIMYECMYCQIVIGTEFGGRGVKGQYLCPPCRTKIQQGFIRDFESSIIHNYKPGFV